MQLDSYSKTPRLMRDRLKTRMEVQHYSRKIEELNKDPKVGNPNQLTTRLDDV